MLQCIQPSKGHRKEPLIPKKEEEMIEVLSMVGDVMSLDSMELSMESSPRPRKRAKLDHLSAEEKAQHRKMMNRISAQSARDRQKALMQLQEVQINGLKSENESLKKENKTLSSKVEAQAAEIARLSSLLKEQEGKMRVTESFSPEVKCEEEGDDSYSSLEPAEGTRTGEKLPLPHPTLGVLDLSEPELIKAFDEFAQQILSPETKLPEGLEEAIAEATQSLAADYIDAGAAQPEGTGLEGDTEGTTMECEFLDAVDTIKALPSDPPAAPAALPMDEPVFQILSNLLEDYPTTPETKPTNNIPVIKPERKTTDLASFLDSYPYDCGWDSPGSVESEIFPDLAF